MGHSCVYTFWLVHTCGQKNMALNHDETGQLVGHGVAIWWVIEPSWSFILTSFPIWSWLWIFWLPGYLPLQCIYIHEHNIQWSEEGWNRSNRHYGVSEYQCASMESQWWYTHSLSHCYFIFPSMRACVHQPSVYIQKIRCRSL